MVMKSIRFLLACTLLLGFASARAQESPAAADVEKGARLVLPVATHNFGDVARKGAIWCRSSFSATRARLRW